MPVEGVGIADVGTPAVGGHEYCGHGSDACGAAAESGGAAGSTDSTDSTGGWAVVGST